LKLTLNPFAASLSAKIGEELQFEAEHAEEGEPEFLQEFKKEGIWQVSDHARMVMLRALC
jgi:hypothetical protein